MYHNLCWSNPYLRHKIYLNIWFHASEDKNCTSTCVYQTHSKPARIKQYLNLCCSNLSGPANTQNVSHLVLIEPLTCQRRHKMHLNMCWPNPSHDSEEKEYISTCDYQTVPMTASTQNECEYTNWICTYVDQTNPMSVRTKNASQKLFIKPLTCQRRHKVHLNLLWRNRSHATENTKCISTYVDQPITCQREQKMYRNMCSPNPSLDSENTNSMCWPNPFIHALTENPSQHVFTKPLPWLQKHRMYLNSSCPCQRETKNVSTCVDTNCMYTCVVQIPPMPAVDQPQTMPARTKKAYQHVLTKPLICQRGHKVHLNFWWSHRSHDSADTKCWHVEKTHPMPEIANIVSQLVFSKPIPWQRGHKIYHMCWPNMPPRPKIYLNIFVDQQGEKKFIWTFVDQTNNFSEDTNCIST